jgi:hypothetical protein
MMWTPDEQSPALVRVTVEDVNRRWQIWPPVRFGISSPQ